jgi:hypothetical protein
MHCHAMAKICADVARCCGHRKETYLVSKAEREVGKKQS